MSLNRNEEVINEIYQNQLDAVLFSVNQYSDDIISSWVSKVENGMKQQEPGSDSIPAGIYQLLNFDTGIAWIFIADTSLSKPPEFFSLGDSQDNLQMQKEVASLVASNTEKIARLVRYKDSGFQKIEPLTAADFPDNYLTLAFVLSDTSAGRFVCGIGIDPTRFISENLSTKLQGIAREKFIISAYEKGVDFPVYSTADTISDGNSGARAVTKDFWLLPDHYLGISLKGKSIDGLVRDRTYTSLGLILLLDAVLILGVWLVFRNVKKEIQLAQNKADFVSNVSHEIRTPLSLISMFAETLEMGRITSEEKRKEYTGIIHKEANRLSGIVNKILNFSQLESGKVRFTLSEVDLNAVVKEVLETYDYHLTSKGFRYVFQPKENVIISADKEAVQEVLVNIIDNAIKYSREEKLIELTTGVDGVFGYVSVKDYGIGIAKKDQKYIFDKFYRVPAGDLAKARGTGLGLSLVKHIADSHNGKVKVESELNKGTLFTIWIPLKNKKDA